jgi:hypothetical protein
MRNIGSDLAERATQDNPTGRRQSHWLGPDHTGTGQLTASSRHNDNEHKNQSQKPSHAGTNVLDRE